MIICTKCGQPNEDRNLQCEGCGHKLQSPPRPEQPDARDRRLVPLGQGTMPESLRALIGKMVESWVYIAILALVAGVSIYLRTFWPLVPALAAVALAAWLRKI